MKKILSVVGARPNFIKIAPLHKALIQFNNDVHHLICHTGQHFDERMSSVFFEELDIPKPHFNLGVSGGSHTYQTANIMLEFEKVVEKVQPDLIIVPGDVNSTLACSLVASKMGVKLAHIESGLRSNNREMPEEINRIVTDVLADFLFVSEPSGMVNLKHEGISKNKVFYVGNIMIDSLVALKDKIQKEQSYKSLNLSAKDYILVTFHRPSNVDNPEKLRKIIELLSRLSRTEHVVFPMHPRTKANIDKFGLQGLISERIITSEPLGYLAFLSLVETSKLMITDSGGIQEECTYMNVPCLTARDDTERPITIDEGTNYLAGTDFDQFDGVVSSALLKPKKGQIPKFWDGKTAERISNILITSI